VKEGGAVDPGQNGQENSIKRLQRLQPGFDPTRVTAPHMDGRIQKKVDEVLDKLARVDETPLTEEEEIKGRGPIHKGDQGGATGGKPARPTDTVDHELSPGDQPGIAEPGSSPVQEQDWQLPSTRIAGDRSDRNAQRGPSVLPTHMQFESIDANQPAEWQGGLGAASRTVEPVDVAGLLPDGHITTFEQPLVERSSMSIDL
jgi:hypothetical protein